MQFHELQFDRLSLPTGKPEKAFFKIRDFWLLHFDDFVTLTSVLMIIAWSSVLLRLLCFVLPRTALCQALMFPGIDGIAASIIAASLFLLYNAAVTAAFVDPDYRYFHFSELLRILISGYAVVLLIGFLMNEHHRLGRLLRSSAPRRSASQLYAAIQSHDLVGGYFAIHRTQLLFLLLILTAALFAWWTHFMVLRTW